MWLVIKKGLTLAYFYTENIVQKSLFSLANCQEVMRPSFSTGDIQELDMLWFLFVIGFSHVAIKSKTKEDDC